MATQSGSSIASGNGSTLPPIYDEQVWDAFIVHISYIMVCLKIFVILKAS